MNDNHKASGRPVGRPFQAVAADGLERPSYDEIHEARITAYALGQLDGEEKAVVEAELAASPAARQEVAIVRVLAGQVRESSRAMVVPPSDTLRAAVELRLSRPPILNIAPRSDVPSAPPLPAPRLPRSWRAWAALAAAVCLLAAAAGLYLGRPDRIAEQTVDQVAVTSAPTAEQLPEAKQAPASEVSKTSEVLERQANPIQKAPEKTDQGVPPEAKRLAVDSPPPMVEKSSDGWRPHVATPVEKVASHAQPAAPEPPSRLARDDRAPPVEKPESKKVGSPSGPPRIEAPAAPGPAFVHSFPRGMRHLPAARPGFLGAYMTIKPPEIAGPPAKRPRKTRAPGALGGPGNFGADVRAAGAGDATSDTKGTGLTPPETVSGKSRPSQTHLAFPPGMRPVEEKPAAVLKAARDSAKPGKKAKSPLPEPTEPEPAEIDLPDEPAGDDAVENEFLPVARFPYSAFSLEADPRAYALVDRYLRAGHLPRADQVEIEGLLNYFFYDDPQPTGDLPFAVHVEGADCPWARDHRLVRIAIVGRDAPAGGVGPTRTEQGASPRPVANHARVQVQFMPALVASYRLIGYDGPPVAGKKAEGSLATGLSFPAGQTVTALYEVVPAPPAKPAVVQARPAKPQRTPARDITAADPSTVLLTVRLHYQRPGAEAYWLLEAPWTDPGQSFDAASRDFRFSAAVAAFGMALRGSRYRGDISLETIERIADSARGEDRERAELVNLVRLARQLGAGPG